LLNKKLVGKIFLKRGNGIFEDLISVSFQELILFIKTLSPGYGRNFLRKGNEIGKYQARIFIIIIKYSPLTQLNYKSGFSFQRIRL
jgi:hypothetical protein